MRQGQPGASKAQNSPAAVFLPFDALTRPHGHVKKNVRLFIYGRTRVANMQQRSRFRCSKPCWNLRKRYSKPL
jgi:hypothetical protein